MGKVPYPDGLCIECFHVPAVHGVTESGFHYAPCPCCEAPHVIAAAQDVPRVPRPERKAS